MFWHIGYCCNRAVGLSDGLSCDINMLFGRGLPVLWHEWAYTGVWSWTGWGGHCRVRRRFPSTRSSGLDERMRKPWLFQGLDILNGKCNARQLFNGQVPVSKLCFCLLLDVWKSEFIAMITFRKSQTKAKLHHITFLFSLLITAFSYWDELLHIHNHIICIQWEFVHCWTLLKLNPLKILIFEYFYLI